MDELTFAGNKYISSKRAGQLTGYTTDYIGQMCRGNKMDCKLVGRNWYVNDEVVKVQKKSFKKEQLEDNQAIEYNKLNLEPMYYSDDVRSNNVKLNKTSTIQEEESEEEVVVEIKSEDNAPKAVPTSRQEPKEETVSILHMVESPVVDLRDTQQEIIKSPLKQVVKREVLLPQKSSIRLPMVKIMASVLILVALLFVAGTFTLQQTMHYASSDSTLHTEYQLAGVGNLLQF